MASPRDQAQNGPRLYRARPPRPTPFGTPAPAEWCERAAHPQVLSTLVRVAEGPAQRSNQWGAGPQFERVATEGRRPRTTSSLGLVRTTCRFSTFPKVAARRMTMSTSCALNPDPHNCTLGATPLQGQRDFWGDSGGTRRPAERAISCFPPAGGDRRPVPKPCPRSRVEFSCTAALRTPSSKQVPSNLTGVSRIDYAGRRQPQPTNHRSTQRPPPSLAGSALSTS